MEKFGIHKSLKKKEESISAFAFNFNIHDCYYKYSSTPVFTVSKNIFEYLCYFLTKRQENINSNKQDFYQL